MRLTLINEDDGSVRVEIRSPDGRRAINFKGVNGEHERNRRHAQLALDDRDGEDDPLNM